MTKYEVIERAGDWIVHHEGVELARYEDQSQALSDVARRLGECEPEEAGAAFTLRYQAR